MVVDIYINAMWVFHWNPDKYGRLSKTKARRVTRGGQQRADIDFRELFVPTVAVSSVRLLTAMV